MKHGKAGGGDTGAGHGKSRTKYPGNDLTQKKKRVLKIRGRNSAGWEGNIKVWLIRKRRTCLQLPRGRIKGGQSYLQKKGAMWNSAGSWKFRGGGVGGHGA